jgi:hypothetical protein
MKNTQKLIQLSENHYVIVDDSQINEGDYKWHHVKGVIKATCDGAYTNEFKITHSTQPLEGGTVIHGIEHKQFINIKYLDLSEVEEAINGYSVEKMAENWFYNEENKNHYENYNEKPAWIKGFKAHQELVKEKNKEVIELLTNITGWDSFKDHPIGKQAKIALDILLPKTEWECCISDGKLTIKI